MSFWRHFVELSPPRRDVVRRPDSARAVGNFLFYRIDPSPHVKLTAFAQEMEDNVVWISYGSAIQSEIDVLRFVPRYCWAFLRRHSHAGYSAKLPIR